MCCDGWLSDPNPDRTVALGRVMGSRREARKEVSAVISARKMGRSCLRNAKERAFQE